MSKGPVHRIRVRAVVAYPAISFVLVAAVAVALTPFGPSQVTAFAATATPTETTAATGTAADVPSPTTTDAPSPTTTDIAGPTATDTATTSLATTPIPDVTPSPAPIPSLASLVSPLVVAGISVNHHILAAVTPGVDPTYLELDGSVLDATQFQTFRVRFQVQNTGTAVEPITTPRLEYRVQGTTKSFVVPEKPEPGIPFHMAGEWVRVTNGGTVQGPLEAGIAVKNFHTGSGAAGVAVDGHHSMSKNPDVQISLPAASYTEEEFTVGLSIDAQYKTIYELRITDGGADIGPDVANIGLGDKPDFPQNSADQRQGTTVEDPTAVAASGLAYPLLNVATAAADTTSATTPAISPSDGTLYPLASGSLSPAVAPSTVVVVGAPSTNVHGQCEACHRGHTAQAPNLLAQSTQSALCFSCHDGSAAATSAGAKDVKSQYALDIPVNVPEKREYYSHDAITSAASIPATARQSDCADCHNPHRAKPTPDSAQVGDGINTPPLSTGWDISGPLTGVSGVSVVNGARGEAPTYEKLDGIDKPVTREYQLCFKCHSGAATLASNTGLEPSQYALDKAVEFNPKNASFHPVEAAGTNGTDKMKASLAGESPYKLWNFSVGSTVRCLNCHASSSTPEPSDPIKYPTAAQPPTAGGDLAPHTSSNRGILLRNYLDRELKPRVDTTKVKAAYSAGDFALCYVCHGEEPFANAASPANSNATNFAFHGLHLTGLKGKGDGGLDVDSAGAGQGNAICAECHFRIHSTTNKVGAQVIPGSRLVNFAPDVQPVSATEPVAWTAGAAGTASCTLTCHGYTHVSLKY